ncbi:hypothetical protein JCM11251_001055 [Rhodosporidiobolus azoricus]
MRVCVLLALSLAGGATFGAAHTSPPVQARIEASWPEAPLITQYLETLALEAPNELFPFLSFLDAHPNSYRSLRERLKPRSYAAAHQLERAGINPVFSDGLLQRNETLAILDAAMGRALRHRARMLHESMQISLANREASVRTEALASIWQAREAEIEEWEKSRFVEEGGVVAHERDKLLHGDAKARKALPYQDEACESWIDVGGKKACTTQEFWLIVGHEQQEEKAPIKLPVDLPSSPRPPLYPLDHVSPRGSQAHLSRVVLYGSPSFPTFQTLFSFLYSLSAPKAVPTGNAKPGSGLTTAKDLAAPHPPRLQFVLRWKPSTRKSRKGDLLEQPNLVLSGYGAALDIKKSDYLAIDDRLPSNSGRKSVPSNQTEPVLEIEGDLAPMMEPVKKSDVPELSLRTAQFILDSAEPFKAFATLTSAFPRLASHLSTLVPAPDPHLLSELSMNQMDLPMLTMRPAFFLNGIQLSEAEIEPFALIRLMRKERKYLSDLTSLNIHMRGEDARKILIDGSPRSKGNSRSGIIGAEALGELYDATDRHEGSQVILWWNDLSKDSRYKSWSRSVRDLLRPTYPGSMNLIARNLNNVVFVLDLSQSAALSLLTENVKQFVSRGIPVRFGVVPLVNTEGAEGAIETQMAQMVWYLVDALGRTPAMKFLSDIYKASPDRPISEDLLRRAYAILRNKDQHNDGGALASFEEVQAGVGKKASSMHSRLNKTRDYLKRLAIPLPGGDIVRTSIGFFLMNGAFFPIDEDFTQNLQRTLGLHTQFLQQEAYSGALTDEDDASTYFAELPSTHKRRNPYVFPSPETLPLKMVNLVDAFEGVDPKFVKHGYVEGAADRINETTGLDIEDPPAVATVFIIGALDDEAGIQLARAALKLADKTTRARVSFVHNPGEPYTAHSWALSNVLYLLHHLNHFAEILPIEILNWIDLEISGEGPRPRQGGDWSDENPLKAVLATGASEELAAKAELWWEEMQWLVHQLGFKPGENGIVINGRVVGPFPDDAFELPDLQDLLDYELDKRINAAAVAVNSTSIDFTYIDRHQQSHLINLASSIVGVASLPDTTQGLFGAGPAERRRDYLRLTSNHSSVIGQREKGAWYEVAVIVDPATETAQRWAPILETLSQLNMVHIRLYLNPAFHLDDIPIKRFYEYSFRPALEFDKETGEEVQPGVRFDNIPEDVLLTFSADLQKSWLAFPKTSVHDLDNIRLADLPAAHKERGVEATLGLQALVIEGHARDMPSSKPPRGLQLELISGDKDGKHARAVNTIVMANLGYFQFPSLPGPSRLAVRPGRSSEVFELKSIGADGWTSGSVSETGDSLYISTLEGLTLYPQFVRKAGHETTELLDETAAVVAAKEQRGTFLERMKNMIPFFATKPAAISETAKLAEINVFTVASGLLYERMAFLMMVSVMRHTETTVKFWFIENFLSPSFKAFIPHVAREYGFDYELVTYKWPHWLRAQKEKQRTIWGYKILFLDVLFPLQLDRVIFVDSDQIVRADLKELVDLDLHGAPYGYAPMGDDRKEMEGFRFWKDGYWKQHLQGKPYHISALYVVDLERFRQIAAGDRLRQQYQALSADPNSLANLDQDLPNNMQNIIPIYTLDQDWLWCETWCGDEGLSTAKTIDLCNNPLTKEEKLKRAKRLIPEWTIYDDEVAALARRVAAESSDASAFTTKADELEQAVQQKKERDELVKEKGEVEERVKDEL